MNIFKISKKKKKGKNESESEATRQDPVNNPGEAPPATASNKLLGIPISIPFSRRSSESVRSDTGASVSDTGSIISRLPWKNRKKSAQEAVSGIDATKSGESPGLTESVPTQIPSSTLGQTQGASEAKPGSGSGSGASAPATPTIALPEKATPILETSATPAPTTMALGAEVPEQKAAEPEIVVPKIGSKTQTVLDKAAGLDDDLGKLSDTLSLFEPLVNGLEVFTSITDKLGEVRVLIVS